MNNANFSTRTKQNHAGVSKRSLLLLGGLAALALNPQARRRLVVGTQGLIDTAGHTLEGTVRPALATAAEQAGQVAQTAVQKGTEALGTLREEGPGRAQALLGTVQEAAGTAAGVAATKAADLTQSARQAAQELSAEGRRDAGQVLDGAKRQAARELQSARKTGQTLLSDVEGRVMALVGTGQDSVESHRRAAERTLTRARRDAEKDLRRAKRHWNAAKLERAVEKRVAPLRKQAARDLARLEKQAGRRERAVQANSQPASHQAGARGGVSGGVVALALLGTGAVVLARIPAARQAILNAVESVSPEAAERLHKAGRDARNIIGTMWLERVEEPQQTPAPGTAKGTQAGTTGGTWGGSPAPGAPAASRTTPDVQSQPRSQPEASKSDKPDAPSKAN